MEVSNKRKLVFFGAVILFLIVISLVYFLYPKKLNYINEAIIIANLCKDQDESCYSQNFKALVNKKGFTEAKKTLFEIQSLEPSLRGCHEYAHAMAYEEILRNPSIWKDLLRSQTYYECSGGFIHGVLEGHILVSKNQEFNIAEIMQICDLPGYAEQSCYHSIGHLALASSHNLEQALNNCHYIKDVKLSYECIGGVFMENVTDQNMDKMSHMEVDRIWSEEEARKYESFCNTFPDKEKKACWKQLSHLFVRLYKSDQEKIYQGCSRSLDKQLIDECYIYSVGNMTRTKEYNREKIAFVCSPYNNTALFLKCMKQLIGALISSSPRYSDDVIVFCSNLEGQFKKSCYEEFSNSLKFAVPKLEDRKKYYLTIPEIFKSYFI